MSKYISADTDAIDETQAEIENFKTITSCISVICISRKNKHYFVNVPGTAIYLRAVSDPVKAIMDIGAVPANEPKMLNRFKRVIKEAEKAKEEANYIGEFKIDSERTLCIFTDEYGEAWGFDKKFFKDFELITDNYKLFYPLPYFNRDKALAGFKDGVLIGLIMPVRFTTDHERKKVNEFVKKTEPATRRETE